MQVPWQLPEQFVFVVCHALNFNFNFNFTFNLNFNLNFNFNFNSHPEFYFGVCRECGFVEVEVEDEGGLGTSPLKNPCQKWDAAKSGS